VIRKGRSASAPPAPTEAGRPRDPRAPGGPLEPFEQVGASSFDRLSNAPFDEFESSTDRFERTSESRKQRGAPTARSGSAPAASQRPGPSLKGRALGYLSRREYSRAELSRKLMPFTDNADELEALLDSLVREGWLSDARFAESIIHRRAARLGATRIVGELKRHAVGDTLIEEVSAQLRETELARARAVWQKKYGKLPEAPAERARQARFLAARGFSMAIIGKILKGIEDDWSEN
jgi:regulatory protein